MYQFEGKVVWVTGSSTGIGRAAALAFAEHGADVIVHANRSVKPAQELVQEIEQQGRRALLVQGDVADREQVKKMVGEVEEAFGRLDVLVNNAGSMIKRARLNELDEELWQRVIDVNLTSVYLVTKYALPLLQAQPKAKVINTTSVAARNGGGLGSIAYATSKGGVSTLTRALAKDLAEYNILVNGVAPGIIDTPFHEQFTAPEVFKKMVSTIPLGRAGTPQDTVGAILFLASDYADYLTGEIIEVNGGQLMD
ncbi:3-oxoacyl-[acyl-carrier protein] reductase [Caldalkalibacillus uzonensis]|uniref:3-oxoacyl-[acyl-carrier protein] reductase n=1 Tax=Caldalkalibacillus uzonensis TaxID=353224 RepID=A0ABU0CQD1_9BACI|nr:SDR family NAD(P)-dependent oxidoreductase [Caldalkalibacillus uzonensis]MDQ0338298.1 3-oxoacyl-[acyl-carrier protein] reductase [Caldalkalibacillus uzonensis]